ncbi:MAG: DUF1552 domain-containing protein [Planctomycetes bacterium]|nr:DUF1552 domain-containing protein [Planctomycetota bacterium]
MSLPVLSRRTVLRGLGTSLALPLLDCMRPVSAAAAGAAAPVRMAFLYVPNGVHMQDWTPATTGGDFPLSCILEPLSDLRGKFSIHTGLAHDKAKANGDGPGDHARALATFLTGTQARKTAGADIRAGVSVDQLAAHHLGKRTRFPSLEIGTEGGGQSGSCDSGYSCVYSANIAWRNETQSVPKESNPRLIFERLFAGGRPGESAEARARREQHELSILDFVQDEAKALERRVGGADRRKLDEYFSAVREVERRIEAAASAASETALGMARPEGIPDSYQDHIRLLGDLLVLSFQTDATRVSTFVFANEGSNRSYAFMGVPEGHHDLSHHGNDPGKQDKIRRINYFHVEQLAYLLRRLDAVQEGDGTLLDHSMLLYGSGIGDGNRHNHNDLPILLAGGAGGAVKQGVHVVHPTDTPLTNLFLGMLDAVGCHAERLGDSTGRINIG